MASPSSSFHPDLAVHAAAATISSSSSSNNTNNNYNNDTNNNDNASNSNNNNYNTNNTMNGIIRYNQLRDMTNHQLCADMNRKALFIEKMNELSNTLLQEIRDTDWMYDRNDGNNTSTNERGGSYYYNGRGGGEEPVLSMRKGMYDDAF